MEEGYELDLTYVTERIIAVSFPQDGFEDTYLRNLRDVTRMLRSKHADNYLVINLSERKQELSKMNPKTLDTGWPDLHAPPLDKICTVCKAMENWLSADPLHVVVIHCRGGKGRIGVVISSFVHFTDVSASADQALDRFAMRKFYDDKVSALMTPSQRRYVCILNSLLSGSIKMNTSPLFLHCVILQGFDRAAVCQPYVKVYQAMQVVYVSGIYRMGANHRDRICMMLEPAQMLKGDIMVKGFRQSSRSERDVMFRVQFHTGAVQAYSLVFQKDDMEHANKDSRFPDYGKVELVFSDGPEPISGSERWLNGPDVTVDYSSTDSLSKWDSYGNLSSEAGPILERLVKRDASRGSTPSGAPRSPDHTLSASTDSGLSSAPDCWPTPGPRAPQPSRQERVELKRLLSGFGLDEASRAPPQNHLNGRSRPKERETDILDDEVLSLRQDLHSADSLGTLSSSCHKSSQNSLLSDGFGSPGRTEETHTAAVDEYERRVAHRGAPGPRHPFPHGGYSTQTWVHQQQLVTAQQYLYLPEEDASEQRFHGHTQELLPKHTEQKEPAVRPETPRIQEPDHKHDEEFSSLTLDIDNSIQQLNQLILDLDPSFVPISTKPGSAPDRETAQQMGGVELSAARGHSSWTLDHTHTLTPSADRDTHTQCGAVFSTDGVQFSSHTALDTGSDVMPLTPAFPISPSTPYGKSVMMNYPPFRQTLSPSFGSYRAEHDTRETAGFMGHTASDEALQHRAYVQPAIGDIMCFSDGYRSPQSISAHPSDSVSFAPVSPHSLPAPNAHSSPLSGPRAKALQQMFGLGPALEGLDCQPPPQTLVGFDGESSQGSASPSGFSSPHSASSLSIPFPSVLPELQTGSCPSAPDARAEVPSSKQMTVNFVQDTSKYWYKPDIARDQAIALLKDTEPGSFIVRDSHSFRGAYGLAMKVSAAPPSALQQGKRGVDPSSELVRHFLIECTPRGVRLKGCPNEPYFGSLTALVCQHSITPLALPCQLIIPDRDPLEEAVSASSQSISNSAAELLKQGAACNVWFLGSVEMESLTGYQAVQKATSEILNAHSLPSSTVVHFKVSSQGITLTDNRRKLFFRRHYAVGTVIFCALDPQDRKWRRDGCSSAKIFGFVARKAGSGMENVCHLFAEHDPEQPASAIVNFVSRVMIGSQKV
ncbi:tensin-3-like [Pimephales promelas]|uniref:tensin-3-like n=1 Tax=Pimephales promelas TaxID=90988 RepID=UPI001955A787|nr:tensin-3-like [Pimephales promelas]KAG1927456.1 tensin-3 [Pimephales promelas]